MANSPANTRCMLAPLVSVISMGKRVAVGVIVSVTVGLDSIVCDGVIGRRVEVIVAVDITGDVGLGESKFEKLDEIKNPPIITNPTNTTTKAVFGLRGVFV